MLVTSIPLKTKLLSVVRAPLTLGDIDALLFERRSEMSADTPGSMTRSWVKLRAEVGRDSSSFWSSVRTTVGEDATMAASATTSTVSVIWPTSKTTSTSTISQVVTRTPDRRSVLKPSTSKTMR
jgi:hypothetical protein